MTDLDCGGGCNPCTVGKKCAENTDCKGAVCNGVLCGPDTCSDKVQDGEETDIDCGGKCNPCKTGKSCEEAGDCESGFGTGKASAMPGVCVTAHCADARKDSDEDGVDCAGKDCPKCADGTVVTRADSCQSGISNGRTCVASTCTDNLKVGDEGDRDCGGSCAAKCGLTQGCNVSSDCAKVAPVCETTRKVCLRDMGMACVSGTECASGKCTNGFCRTSATLKSVWGTSANSVWTGSQGAFLKWNGSTWTSMSPPSHALVLTGVDSNNIWAVGLSGAIV